MEAANRVVFANDDTASNLVDDPSLGTVMFADSTGAQQSGTIDRIGRTSGDSPLLVIRMADGSTVTHSLDEVQFTDQQVGTVVSNTNGLSKNGASLMVGLYTPQTMTGEAYSLAFRTAYLAGFKRSSMAEAYRAAALAGLNKLQAKSAYNAGIEARRAYERNKQTRETEKQNEANRRRHIREIAAQLDPGMNGENVNITRDENGFPTSYISVKPSHTEEERARIEAYLNAVDQEMLNAAYRHRYNPENDFEYLKSFEVSDRLIDDLKRKALGNYEGYKHVIDSNFFKHTENEHGIKGRHDKSMIDLNDVARVKWVLENYDEVGDTPVQQSTGYNNKGQKPLSSIRYSKRIDGTVYVVEAIGESTGKTFRVISAFIGETPANMQGTQSSQSSDVTSPGLYALDGIKPTTMQNITQGNGSVNTESDIRSSEQIVEKTGENFQDRSKIAQKTGKNAANAKGGKLQSGLHDRAGGGGKRSRAQKANVA